MGGERRSLPCGRSDGPAASLQRAEQAAFAKMLLEAERSHQRSRIEILNKQLDISEALVEFLKKRLDGLKILEEVWKELNNVSAALQNPATRAQRPELALRWPYTAAWELRFRELFGDPCAPPSLATPPRFLMRLTRDVCWSHTKYGWFLAFGSNTAGCLQISWI